MGLYNALSEKELDKSLNDKCVACTPTWRLNILLRRGTTWGELDTFLENGATAQFSKKGEGWNGIYRHLIFCCSGDYDGKPTTWCFNLKKSELRAFASPCNTDVNSRIVISGFSNGITLEPRDLTSNSVSCSAANVETVLSLSDDKSIDDFDFSPKEGAPKYAWHRKRERDPEIVRLKKVSVLRTDPLLRCEVCSTSMEKRYGSRGAGFCEIHHKKPLFLVDENDVSPTQLSDLAILCPNCHRMIHRYKQETLTIQALKDMLKERTMG